MKTAILFSALSYLIGLTIGAALENVKSALTNLKPAVISAEPVKEKTEKTYPFEGEKPAIQEQVAPAADTTLEKR